MCESSDCRCGGGGGGGEGKTRLSSINLRFLQDRKNVLESVSVQFVGLPETNLNVVCD